MSPAEEAFLEGLFSPFEDLPDGAWAQACIDAISESDKFRGRNPQDVFMDYIAGASVMSMVVQCPKCGEPMDVPAYPGDGVYREHSCAEDTMARLGWALLWAGPVVMLLAFAGIIT